MDTLEYMSASGEFAIMRKGVPSKRNVEKELEGLLDMRPDSSGFVEKQLRPFLERYGRQFEANELLMTGSVQEDDGRLAELGYGIIEASATSSYLYQKSDGMAGGDTYVVEISSPYSHTTAFMDKRKAFYYVAELGLVSQGFECKDIVLTPIFDKPAQTTTYTLYPPPSLWLDPQGTDEMGRWAPLMGTVADHSGQSGWFEGLNVDSENGSPRWTLTFMWGSSSRDENGKPINAYPDWVKMRPDGRPDEKSLNMIAAGQLLSLIAERYHFRQRDFVVDPTMFKLKENDTPDLMKELVRCIAAGKVHPCAHCDRPVMGGTWYCRGRRCKASDLEKAKLLAAAGHGVDEIFSLYPHIKRVTIEGYVEDAKNGL